MNIYFDNGFLDFSWKKVCDCKGWRSFFGLRFRKSFNPYDAFFIHITPNARLDSYFVSFPFIAVWLDVYCNILKVEVCYPNKFFDSIKGQSLVVELPLYNFKFF